MEEREIIKQAVFDYGSINDDHMRAATEICKLLTDSGLEDMAKFISVRFNLETIPEYDVRESDFYKECSKVNIFVAVQGFLQEGTGTDAIKYPLVHISGDIRKMDELVKSIKNG